jgi:hypothetical protein
MRTEKDMGLNQGTCCLPLGVEKDTASADENESDDTDLIVHEEVPPARLKLWKTFSRKWKNRTKTHIVKVVIVTITVT